MSETNAPEVRLTEVGLRDGLQNQPRPIATEGKLALAGDLLAAGLRCLEVSSFVSPKAVPQMADAEAVFAGLPARADVRYTGLIANDRGYERALAAGCRDLGLVIAATDTFNRRNINTSLAEATERFEALLHRARADGVRTRLYVSCACACPFEGDVDPEGVLALAERFLAAGAHEISIADTIGAGSPTRVDALVRPLVRDHGPDAVNLHVHDTRGQALAMIWAGWLAGVRSFDASVGGLGGCPFAPGATGNVATEDVVHLFERCGIGTGVDHGGLLAAVERAEALTGQALGGQSARWLRSRQARSA
jgi:hydroxymethylglutaryl-CoA lyase